METAAGGIWHLQTCYPLIFYRTSNFSWKIDFCQFYSSFFNDFFFFLFLYSFYFWWLLRRNNFIVIKSKWLFVVISISSLFVINEDKFTIVAKMKYIYFLNIKKWVIFSKGNGNSFFNFFCCCFFFHIIFCRVH